jgi:uncharacterized protein YjbJ (UPF0337 family)
MNGRDLMLEKTEGTLQKLAGKVQTSAGDVLNDPGMQVNGKIREFAGRAQESYGDTLNHVREATTRSPVGTLVIATTIGFVIGALWAKR